MNNSEVLEKLRAYLKCRERQVTGIYYACNNKKCDDCDLCYMQGTTGEHIEAVEVATQALEKLKDYEDLEGQGRLIKLPYKDVYFIVDANNPKYALVMRRSVRELAICEIEKIDKKDCKYFSTEEKAEAKLKELRGGENGK